MKTPFTTDQFLDIFRSYNESVFPTQVILFLGSLITIYLAVKPTSNSDKIISGFLAFLWLWMGFVYHLIFFSVINKAAYFFGAMFILQGIIFLYFGVFQSKLSFKLSYDNYSLTGMILVSFALIVYPVIGYAFGHRYPSSPTFGLPCPTTIFTFGLLFLSDKKWPVSVLIIPLLWSVFGFSAVFLFGMPEDLGLLVSGLLTISILLAKNKKFAYM